LSKVLFLHAAPGK